MSSFHVSTKRSGGDGDSPGNTNAEDGKRGGSGDVPFLVTHWLGQFGKKNDQGRRNQDQAEALQKIRLATAEIASAFSTLGAYGTVNPVRHSSRYLETSGKLFDSFFPVHIFANMFLHDLVCIIHWTAGAAAIVIQQPQPSSTAATQCIIC